MLSINDKNFEFSYQDNSTLQWSQDQHRDNLTSVLAYYANLILAMDYDSFSLEGGTDYYLMCQTIVNNAQNAPEEGWKASQKGQQNRYWIIENILSQSFKPLREALYNYHRQGLDVLYRASFGKLGHKDAAAIQRSFFVRGMTMAALSAMYWALTHDDDEYKKQEQETKDNNWLVPSLGVKIPIPFEIGVIFKVIPERTMAYFFGDDTGKDFMKSMARQLSSTLAVNPIPQAALPLVEATTNYSFFTQRAIVGQGMEGIAPEYQVGPNTSAIAAQIGSALGISPMKLDHIIGGYTGTMGMYMVSALDSIMNMNSDTPNASKRFEQMPLIKRFALDPEARGTVTSYYELKNAADQAVRTSNLLERTMNFEEKGEFMRDNIKLLASKEFILDMEKTMKEFRQMHVMIRSSRMDADAKRDALLRINQAQNALTANINTLKANVS
jgi:hypothetical protein